MAGAAALALPATLNIPRAGRREISDSHNFGRDHQKRRIRRLKRPSPIGEGEDQVVGSPAAGDSAPGASVVDPCGTVESALSTTGRNNLANFMQLLSSVVSRKSRMLLVKYSLKSDGALPNFQRTTFGACQATVPSSDGLNHDQKTRTNCRPVVSSLTNVLV